MQRYSEYYVKRMAQLGADVDEQFCEWIDEVEDGVLSNTHHYLLDLPDEMYMMYFEDGYSVSEMIHIVIGSTTPSL